ARPGEGASLPLPDLLQVAEEIGIGIDHDGRVPVQRPVALERLEERVELGIRAERLTVDAGRFGVGGTADLRRTALGFRAYPAQIPLHPAEDRLAPPLAFRAEARRDALPLRDHPRFDLRADGIDVVDPLDAHVDQLDPQLRHRLRRRGEHVALELRAALFRPLEIRLLEGLDLLLREAA